MIIENILSNKGARQVITTALGQLRSVNLFSALLDYGHFRVEDREKFKDEYRAAFLDGYSAAIKDVFYFDDRFPANEETGQLTPRPDYGALDRLLETNQITQKEYDKLKSSR